MRRKTSGTLLLALVGVLVAPCAAKASRPIRIAVATFQQETCTFAPEPTTIADWEVNGPPTRDFLSVHYGYVGGFVDACKDYEGVNLVGLTSPAGGVAGGSQHGWVTRAAFEKYSGLILRDLKQLGPFDGIFLALHGAMAVTGVSKPEAELARRVRRVVGEKVPIVVTLDLHANVDHELSDAADAVFIVKRYPHYDTTLQGERAARLLIKTIRGRYKPTMATRKPGVMTPSVFQGTGTEPAKTIMERARRWECRSNGAYVSVAFGFAYADVPNVGATVMVVTNDNQKQADMIADDMSNYIWRVRKEFAGKKLPETKEGVAMAIQDAREGKLPVVVADQSDRSGGSSQILEELIRQKAKNFCIATLCDEKAIAKIQEGHFKVGDSINLKVGGYADKFAGNPVPISGKITYLGEYEGGDAVVIAFDDNNYVILSQHLVQVTDTQIFNAVGIDFKKVDVVVLKSRVHFWKGFVENGLAGAVIVVDAPGWGPADLSKLPYKNIPKDIYPIYRKD